ncbi:MAG: amidohydrolase, partial [Planctomycetota bacterium]
MRCWLLGLVVILVACGDETDAPVARGVPLTLYHGAVVHTVDPQRPQAEAFAVEDERIFAVGALAEVEAACAGRDVRRVDLEGACVVPGLIDAHGHLAGLGRMRRQLDLRDATSYEEVIERVRAHAATLPAGTWILGGRWDQATWGEKDFPVHGPLSEVTPDHPVLLSRVDGHAALANAEAMALAGISRDTRAPEGGEVLRGEDGEPTGMFVDNAIGLVRRAVTEASVPTGDLWRAAEEACFRAGLTCVHDAGVSASDVEDLRERYRRGELSLRVHAMLSAGGGIVDYMNEHDPVGDTQLSVRAVKVYVDGAMGSRGAWMLADYSDRPGHTGLAVTPVERI